MIKENLLVFDIDGTLLDSENVHQTGFVNALHAIGVASVDTDWESYTHLTDSFIAKANYEKNTDYIFSSEILIQLEAEFLNQIIDCKVTQIKGANTFLQTILKETSYAICFATGSMLQPAILKLDRAEIVYNQAVLEASNNYFTREEIVQASIAKAKTHFNVNDFKRIISIGDGVWDVKTAQNLGIEFIGIGTENREKLASKGAKYHFINFESFDMKLL